MQMPDEIRYNAMAECVLHLLHGNDLQQDRLDRYVEAFNGNENAIKTEDAKRRFVSTCTLGTLVAAMRLYRSSLTEVDDPMNEEMTPDQRYASMFAAMGAMMEELPLSGDALNDAVDAFNGNRSAMLTPEEKWGFVQRCAFGTAMAAMELYRQQM